jgi:microcompartment protein CcmK/EutM
VQKVMQIARVIGTVVSTRRDPATEGWSLLVVEHLDVQNQPTGKFTVAVDAIGVGPDEVVMFTSGSAARQTNLTAARPCDAVIMAVVDTWEIEGETVYLKDTPRELNEM